MRACVGGWGTAVPEKLVTNAEMEQRVDTTDAWIVERTGIRERHVAATTEAVRHRETTGPPVRGSTR